jgi:hypothetical protein
MFQWKVVSKDAICLIEAMSLAYDYLIAFLFEKARSRLRDLPEVLLEKAGCFSSGEKLLIGFALDMWNQSGGAQVWALLARLDQHENVLLALQYLGTSSSICAEKEQRPFMLALGGKLPGSELDART